MFHCELLISFSLCHTGPERSTELHEICHLVGVLTESTMQPSNSAVLHLLIIFHVFCT